MPVAEALAKVLKEGWPVFPCNPLNKTPLVPRGFKDATTDKKQIAAWWKQWPNAMIGVPMGRASGIFCVDLDRKEGQDDGVVTWQQWKENHGGCPETREHITPSTGQHVIFKWQDGIRNIPLNKLGPGIDIRGDGGYIVVPPSKMHDGKEYFSNNLPVADAPLWLIVRIDSYYEEQRRYENESAENYMEGRVPPTKEELREWLNYDSNDYDVWYRTGGGIFSCLGDAGFDLFEEWSRKSKKYNAKDCARKWKQIKSLSRISVGTIYYYAKQHDASWEPYKEQEQEQEQKPAGPWIWEKGKKWDTEHSPPRQWAVEERIPLRRVCLFSGQGAAGKSLLQLQLTVAHILGADWLGGKTKQGPAIYIDAEDEIDEIHHRMDGILEYHQTRFSKISNNLYLKSLAGQDAVLATFKYKSGKVEATKLYQDLLKEVTEIKPVMIGIASSADIFAGNENDRTQVQQFINLLTGLAIAGNSAVNLISHPSLTGIETDSGISGNTAWHNSVRARMYLKSGDGEMRELQFKKNNYGPIEASILVHWKNGLFLPIGIDGGASTKAEIAKSIFVQLLRIYINTNRDVNDKRGRSYAPNLFAEETMAREAGCDKNILADAMRDLLTNGIIKVEEYDHRGRKAYRLTVSQTAPENPEMPF